MCAYLEAHTHTHTHTRNGPCGVFIRSLSPGGKGELGTRALSGTSPPRAVTPYFNHQGGTRTHVPKSMGPRPWLLGLHHHDEPPRRTADHDRDQATAPDQQQSATMTAVHSSWQPLYSSCQVRGISSPPTRLLIGRGVVGRTVASPHWSGRLGPARPSPIGWRKRSMPFHGASTVHIIRDVYGG